MEYFAVYSYPLIFGSRGPFDVITRNDLPLNLNLTWSQPFVKTIENKIDSNNSVSFFPFSKISKLVHLLHTHVLVQPSLDPLVNMIFKITLQYKK